MAKIRKFVQIGYFCIVMTIDVTERARCAMDYFKQGYNCSQSVVLAFQDIMGIDKEQLTTLACGLGGGMGRLREVCGTVGAIALMAGRIARLKESRLQADSAETSVATSPDPTDSQSKPGNLQQGGEAIRRSKTDAYTVVQELSAKFKEDNGSIICRDLLGIRAQQHSSLPGQPQQAQQTRTHSQQLSPEASQRTKEYYQARPCEALVGFSATIIAEYLAKNC